MSQRGRNPSPAIARQSKPMPEGRAVDGSRGGATDKPDFSPNTQEGCGEQGRFPWLYETAQNPSGLGASLLAAVRRSGHARIPVDQLPPPAVVLMAQESTGRLEEALGLVCLWRKATSKLDSRSSQREVDEMARFVSAAMGAGVNCIDGLTPTTVDRFARGAVHHGLRPQRPRSTTVSHRLSAVRTFLDGCRALGLCPPDWDPSVGLDPPPANDLLFAL